MSTKFVQTALGMDDFIALKNEAMKLDVPLMDHIRSILENHLKEKENEDGERT